MHSLFKQIAASLLAGGLLWLLLVDSVQWQELLAGAVCIVLSLGFMAFVSRQTQNPRRFLLRDVGEVWRVPGAILADSARITRFLLRALVQGEPPQTGYTTTDFTPAGPRNIREGRTTLAVLFTTAGPNTIALGVSESIGCMLLHTLEPAPTPAVIHALAMETSRP